MSPITRRQLLAAGACSPLALPLAGQGQALTALDLLAQRAFLKFERRDLGAHFNMTFVAPLKDNAGNCLTRNGQMQCYYLANQLGVGLATSPDGVFFTDRGSVLRRGPGVWDSEMASFADVVWGGRNFFMVYEGKGASRGEVGLATSSDGLSFQKSPFNPILRITEGFERANIGTPSLLRVGTESPMHYHGFDWTDLRVGLARGSDLTNLQKEGRPLLSVADCGWDSGTIGRRGIIQVGNRWVMVYEGSTDAVGGDFGKSRWSSGLATSPDLVTWTKYSLNPILPETPSNFGMDGPTIVRISGKTYIYYRHLNDSQVTRRAVIANETNGGFVRSWRAVDLPHLIGTSTQNGWTTKPGSSRAEYLTYGPISLPPSWRRESTMPSLSSPCQTTGAVTPMWRESRSRTLTLSRFWQAGPCASRTSPQPILPSISPCLSCCVRCAI